MLVAWLVLYAGGLPISGGVVLLTALNRRSTLLLLSSAVSIFMPTPPPVNSLCGPHISSRLQVRVPISISGRGYTVGLLLKLLAGTILPSLRSSAALSVRAVRLLLAPQL